jgi:hypothetical protein
MAEANLTIKGKQVLDFESGLPIKIKIKGNTPNNQEIEKLKILKQDVLQDVEQPVSGFGSAVDNQLGMVFSFPTTTGARIAYQGAKDIISNIASFGFDIASFFTDDDEKKKELQDTSQKIRDFAPDVKDLPFYTGGQKSDMTIGQARPIQQNVEDVISTGGQYIAPAVGVTKLTNLTKLPKVFKYPTNVAGVVASDIAVTNPDKAVTVADLFGANKLPTKIQEDDTNLEKRVKVGAESFGIIGAVDTLGAGVKAIIPKSVKESVSAPFSSEAQKDLLSKNIAESIYKADPEKFPSNIFDKNTKLPDDVTEQLIKNIDEAVESAKSVGAKATTGTASKNVGIIAMERGLSTAKNTSSAMTFRKQENMTNMLNALDKAMKIKDTKAISEFTEEASSALKFEQNYKKVLDNKVQEAMEETENLISTFKNHGKKDPSILSSNIDEALKTDLKNLVANKNTLFDNIDPRGTVIVDKTKLREGVKEAILGKPVLDLKGKRIPFTKTTVNKITKKVLNNKDTGSILNDLKKLSDPKSKTQLRYIQLAKIRPILTAKINSYIKDPNYNGDVVQRLAKLKQVINSYTDDLINNADPSVAQRAKDAMNYYKKTFTPAWKQGVGQIFKTRNATGNPFFSSEVAGKFIIGKPTGGSKETIAQINNIIRRASKTEDAQALLKDDVNDYLLYQFAQKVTGKNYKTSLPSVEKFIENHRQILKTPEFEKANSIIQGAKRELQVQGDKILSNNTKLKELQKQVSQREKDIAHKTLSNLIEQNPSEFVSSILKLPLDKALKAINEAKLLVKGNSLAEKGLKDSFIDFAYDAVTKGSGNTMTGDIITDAVSKYDNFIRGDVAKIYEEILGKNGLDTIKKVHTTLKTFNNLNIKAVTDSGTANLLAQTLNNSRIFLASMYGIIKGGAIFRLSELVSKALGFQPKATMENLLVMSFLDPELGKEMLKRANGQTIKPFQLKMKSYIANNLPEIQETSQQNKKRRFALAR